MTLAHVVVDGSDSKLLDAIYEFGKANVLPPETACAPVPYPLRSTWQSWADDTAALLVAISDDDGLRGFFHIRADGVIGGAAVKPYIDVSKGQKPGDDPRGPVLMSYVRDLAIAHAGTCKTLDPNADTQAMYRSIGVDQAEP